MYDLYNTLFSPISKEYCLYFELLMYLAFFGVIVTVIGVIAHAFFSKKKKKESILTYLLAIFQSGLYYFLMRLLYSMCIR